MASQGGTGSGQALYRLDIEVEFLGRAPRDYNRGAPEVGPIHYAAVAGMERLLKDAGYEISRLGHGSMRLDREAST